jgi:hypothetical protein
MQAPKLATGVQTNIYTDSKYAFTTIRVHGASIGRGALLMWEEKVSSIGRKSSKW